MSLFSFGCTSGESPPSPQSKQQDLTQESFTERKSQDSRLAPQISPVRFWSFKPHWKTQTHVSHCSFPFLKGNRQFQTLLGFSENAWVEAWAHCGVAVTMPQFTPYVCSLNHLAVLSEQLGYKSVDCARRWRSRGGHCYLGDVTRTPRHTSSSKQFTGTRCAADRVQWFGCEGREPSPKAKGLLEES